MAPDGTAYTVLTLEDAGSQVTRDDLEAALARDRGGAAYPLATPAVDLLERASLVLVALGPDGLASAGLYDPDGDGGEADGRKADGREGDGREADDVDTAYVVRAGLVDPAAETELGRQLLAHVLERGGTALRLFAPATARSRLADELGDAGTPVPDAPAIDADLRSDAARRTTRFPARRADVSAPPSLSALVEPSSVAVLGASERPDSVGRVVLENLLDGFSGDVHPVTPRHAEILGVPAVDSLSDLATPVDLAVIVLPPEMVLEAVRAAGETGVRAVAVLSAGFGETDDEAGHSREQALRELVERYDLSLVGPNALGVISTRNGLDASFAPTVPDAGGVSVVSHSGAMITAILDWAEGAGVGVRDVVSLGNRAGVDEADLVRFWGADPGTDLIVAYFEDLAAGRAFIEAARAVTPATPVLALKGGRSDAGAAAAASHTGAIVDADAGFDAAFAAGGVVRVDTQAALFDAIAAFATQPPVRGDRVGVVTNAGGPGVLATDAVEAAGLTVAELSDETRDALATELPDTAAVGNPVDVLGDAPVDRFVQALEAVLADPGVDAALVVTTPHPLVPHDDLVRAVGDAGRRYGVPVAAVIGGGPAPEAVVSAASDARVPLYDDADRAARALAALATYARRRERPVADPTPVTADRSVVRERLQAATDAGRETLGVESMDLLSAYGVPTPASRLATSRAEAAAAATEPEEGPESIDGPAALKVASPDLAHKTDVGGVRVGVAPDDVGEVADDLLASVTEAAPAAVLDGVLVQEMVPDGLELLVGVTRHARFGPLVTVGLGGVDVESLDATAHGLAPLAPAEAERLLESAAGDLLDTHRGREAVDRDALVDAVVRLSWLADEWPTIEELEVNPLVATADGVWAVDFHASLSVEE